VTIASVLIPAHNEATVIDRCLSTLLEDANPMEFEVIVACNACSDDTAQRARRHPGVRVIELSEASKAIALQAGDVAATVFPRIYLDADIRLSTAAARSLAERLVQPGVEAAAPRVHFDVTARPWTITTFFEILKGLPALGEGYVGSGVFALSNVGRSRFEVWPEHLPDDAFVQRLVPADRRATSDGEFIVTTPRTLRAQMHRSVRVRRLNHALERAGLPLASGSTAGSTRRHLLRLLRKPAAWPGVLLFTATSALVRARAALADQRRSPTNWLRDDTSR